MNGKIKRVFLTSLLVSMFLYAFPQTTFAANASASASPSSVNIGDTVTVKVTFKGTNIGAVQGSFSYDSGILQYVSGNGVSGGGGSGSIVLVTSSENTTSLSTTITFKALKAGSTTVSISASDVLSYDESSLGGASASAKVTVKAPTTTTTTPKPSTTTTNTSTTNTSTSDSKPKVTTTETVEKEEPKAPTPLEEAIKVSVGDSELYLWRDLSTVPLPDNFKMGESTYKTDKIEVAIGKDKDISLAYLTNAEGKKGSFYVYDSKTSNLYPYLNFTTKASYIIMKLDSSATLPEGYKEATLKLDDQSVQAWVKESGENPDFYLIYAMNSKGSKEFYFYDKVDETVQRYVDRTVVSKVDKEAVSQTLYQKLSNDRMVMTVVGLLGASSIILLLLLIVLYTKLKKIR